MLNKSGVLSGPALLLKSLLPKDFDLEAIVKDALDAKAKLIKAFECGDEKIKLFDEKLDRIEAKLSAIEDLLLDPNPAGTHDISLLPESATIQDAIPDHYPVTDAAFNAWSMEGS